jgi:GNAT superfamily N-acetyltransferase
MDCKALPSLPESPDLIRDGYTISTDPARLDVAAIHAYLSRSYWAEGIPLATVAESLRHSFAFGLFDPEGRQVGLARVITDRATYAYLCDVYVLEGHRSRNLGKWLVEAVVGHPALAGLRRFTLATRDAHALYAQYGFQPLRSPDRHMEIVRPDVYKEKR